MINAKAGKAQNADSRVTRILVNGLFDVIL